MLGTHLLPFTQRNGRVSFFPQQDYAEIHIINSIVSSFRVNQVECVQYLPEPFGKGVGALLLVKSILMEKMIQKTNSKTQSSQTGRV